MGPDKIIVAVSGAIGIIFTYWFFLFKQDSAVIVQKNVIDIVVDGGYSPDTILVKKGKTTTINFLRKDPSSCLEEVVLGDFNIRKQLPLNKKISIAITPKTTGTYAFSCGMHMFHGKIIVA